MGKNLVRKRIIISIFAAVMLITTVAIGVSVFYKEPVKKQEKSISMMIATDIHYLSESYLKEDSYFHTPSAETDGKVVHYSGIVMDALVHKALQEQPDILILSGDLTLNGSAKSHEDLIQKLTKIKAAGVQILVIPGNHDVDTAAFDYSKEEITQADSLLSQGFLEFYEDFGPNQALSRETEGFSYIYEADERLRILMLDSNCFKKGRVKAETLEWMEAKLKEAKEDDADVIMVSHQNLYAHNEKLSFGYQFYNAEEVQKLVEEYDVICNLGGHIHTQSIVREAVPEIVTAALSLHTAPYGELVYDGKSLSYTAKSLDVEAYAGEQGIGDENLLNYNSYSRQYFEEVARLQVYENLSDSGLSQEEQKCMADTFAEINSRFFIGEPVDASRYDVGIALWKQQEDSFITAYIDTMLESGGMNQLEICIDCEK